MNRTPAYTFLDPNVGNINIVKKSTDALLGTKKEIVLEVNADNGNGSFTFTRRHLCCNTVTRHSHFKQPVRGSRN
jgi:hypothetical protein